MLVFDLILAPLLELATPLFLLLLELFFWLILYIKKAFIALFKWQKPKWPVKPSFTKARNKTKNLSKKIKEKRAKRHNH